MKILLATDGSTFAEAAARFLRRLRCDEPMEITLLTNVALPNASKEKMTDTLRQDYQQQQQSLASDNLRQAQTILSATDAKISEMVVEGHVGRSILKAVETVKADLVVVGAKGHSAIHRVLLGSVSDYVATHANCSVLVIRPTLAEDPSDSIDVTLAVDETPPSEVALNQLKQFDWDCHTAGQLLCVIPVFRFYRQDLKPSAIAFRTKQRQAARAYADRAIEALSGHKPKFTATVMESQHVGEAIVDFLHSHESDLAVMGGGQHSRLGQIVLGSVSRYVLHHAKCSVWIARQRVDSAT